jgi:hypothetical protein
MVSSGLVLLMIPAVCLLYSGHGDNASGPILFRLPLITTAIVGCQVVFRRRASKMCGADLSSGISTGTLLPSPSQCTPLQMKRLKYRGMVELHPATRSEMLLLDLWEVLDRKSRNSCMFFTK